MAKRILVTGACGLIGRELFPYLQQQGHDVVGIDNQFRFPEYVNHDVINTTTEEYLHQCTIKFDYIYHLSAINGTKYFYSIPNTILTNNIRSDLTVFEYAQNTIKKAVVGVGHADKVQVKSMVKIQLPKANLDSQDSVDALSIALCHAYQYKNRERLNKAILKAEGR